MKPSTVTAANKALKEFLQKHQTADKTKKTHTVFNGSILEVNGPSRLLYGQEFPHKKIKFQFQDRIRISGNPGNFKI